MHRLAATELSLLSWLAIAPLAAAQVSAVRIASRLPAPTWIASPPLDPRLFLVERAGTIRILEAGVPRNPTFLDIRTQVNTDVDGGLLGLVFAPDFATSGVFNFYATVGMPF
jgi:glucose/arabinose dehydrogenase